MIDQEMMEQLQSVFARLQGKVELVYDESGHEKQGELVQMLQSLAQTSEKISVSSSGESCQRTHFFLRHNGKDTGVSFVGIPGGHEFTSLVLAVLNADGQGKLPDPLIIKRIAGLKGPIRLKTYISLSCENCPDVVQALNLMALSHPDFTHQMVDGEMALDEVQALGIQGVPSVVSDEKLISAGKIGLVDLIKKLEEKFGVQSSQAQKAVDLGEFDVVVVGGGPAGASAAIYSARKGLRTAIIAERMGGQIQDTKGIENFISLPYTEGPQLSAQLAKHVSTYDIQLLEHRRPTSITTGPMKSLQLDSGEFLSTKAMIVATGAKWRELGVPGEKEYIGRGVAYCPHCDGPYYKGKDVVVVGGGNSGVEAAIDLSGIVKSVVLLEFAPELKADQVLVDKLMGLANVRVLKNARTLQVVGNGEKVIALEYEDREQREKHTLPLDGVFVQIGLIPNSGLLKGVVETNRYGEIVIDDKCRTSAPGIYAAGDVATVPFKQIIIAMGEGAKAALTAFEELKF